MPRKIFPPCLAVAGLLAVAAFFPGVLRADPATSDPVAQRIAKAVLCGYPIAAL